MHSHFDLKLFSLSLALDNYQQSEEEGQKSFALQFNVIALGPLKMAIIIKSKTCTGTIRYIYETGEVTSST